MAYDGLSERTQRIDAWPETGGEEPTEEDRDRLAVHGVWEALLVVVVVMGTAVTYQIKPDALVGTGLQAFLLFAAALGIIAVGVGWSLRAAVPNLAVGTIAIASAVFFGQQSQGGFWFGLGVTLGAAVTIGLLAGLLVVVLGVPAWAGTLGIALLLGSWLSVAGWVDLPDVVRYDPMDHSLYWFLGFMAASLLGGVLGAFPPVRRSVGGYRPSGDPAERVPFGPGMAGFFGLVGSSALASLSGVLLALMGRGSTADLGIGWTGLAFGAVLLGGTSAYGRRGGVTGTLFGVVLLALGVRLASEAGWRIPNIAFGAVAVLLGLLVTRLVETFGRTRTRDDSEAPDWATAPPGWTPPPDSLARWTPHHQQPGGGRTLMALPAGSGGDPALHARPGAAVLEESRGGVAVRGGVGGRAGRLSPSGTPAAAGGVLSGDIVPGDRAATGYQRGGPPVPRSRIWDVEPGGPAVAPNPY